MLQNHHTLLHLLGTSLHSTSCLHFIAFFILPHNLLPVLQGIFQSWYYYFRKGLCSVLLLNEICPSNRILSGEFLLPCNLYLWLLSSQFVFPLLLPVTLIVCLSAPIVCLPESAASERKYFQFFYLL